VIKGSWFKYCVFLVLLVFVSSCASSCENVDRTRPNIVLILADDFGYGDIGSINHDSKVSTPNLDRLIAEGINMRDAHSPSSVCTPTRYSILTGRYAWRSSLKSGVLWGYSPYLIEDGRPTIATMLKEQGYNTGGFGKWHLGLGSADSTDYSQPLTPGPMDAGFDYYFGIPASLDMQPYVYIENDGVVEPPTDHIEASVRARNGGGGFWRAGPIAPGFKHDEVLDRSVDKAVEFIENQKSDKPFFAYVPLPSPHTPWLPTGSFVGSSRSGPYGDFVNMTDHSVGRILEAIDNAGAAENTLVIFTSDNGADWTDEEIEQYGHDANNGLRGRKADIWEAGHRVPLIARWPGEIWKNSHSDEPVSLIDLFATISDITQYSLEEESAEDSFSIRTALEGRTHNGPIRPQLVHHSLDGTFAIRWRFWKYIDGLGSGGFTEPVNVEPEEGGPTGMLFDIFYDRKETKDHYLTMPERVQDLKEQLEKIKKDGRTRPL